MVFGTFDVIHPGHVFFLKEAKKHGWKLFVIVARDSAVTRKKKRFLWYTDQTRVRHIRVLGIADRIFLGDTSVNTIKSFPIIQKWKPDVVAVGYDQTHLVGQLRKASKTWPWRMKIVRIKAFRPRQYKSSLLKKRMLARVS